MIVLTVDAPGWCLTLAAHSIHNLNLFPKQVLVGRNFLLWGYLLIALETEKSKREEKGEKKTPNYCFTPHVWHFWGSNYTCPENSWPEMMAIWQNFKGSGNMRMFCVSIVTETMKWNIKGRSWVYQFMRLPNPPWIQNFLFTVSVA